MNKKNVDSAKIVGNAKSNALLVVSESKSEEIFQDDSEYLTRKGGDSLHDGAEKIVRRYREIMDMCSPRSRFTEREFNLICACNTSGGWDYRLHCLNESLAHKVEDCIAIEHADKEYGVEDCVALVEKLKQLTPIEAVALMNLVEEWFESSECGEVAKVGKKSK